MNTALTGRGTLTAELSRDGWHPPEPPTLVIPPWVIALERWVNEGGCGDDPDDAAWLAGAHSPPRQQKR